MKLTAKTLGAAVSLLCALCALPVGWAAYSAAMYLMTYTRFEVQKLSVSGLKRVQENQVLAKAGFDIGTNVFRVKLDEIREHVEELPWVRHAVVERVLPDKILIQIVEREPVGLARINGEVFQFDIDGTVLDPDPVSGASFPILDGLRMGDHKRNLEKVEVYRRVVDDLGQISPVGEVLDDRVENDGVEIARRQRPGDVGGLGQQLDPIPPGDLRLLQRAGQVVNSHRRHIGADIVFTARGDL